MRITAVEPIIVEVPTHEPVKGVRGLTNAQRSVLVRLVTDRDIVGWGNVDPSPGYTLMSADGICAAIGSLAPVLAGRDVMNLTVALATMDGALADASEAKAAVEMALCDATARVLGIPVHVLLGGAAKSEIPLNAWMARCRPNRRQRGAGWLERGFRSAKIKLVGRRHGRYPACCRGARCGRHRMALRVDFNESLPMPTRSASSGASSRTVWRWSSSRCP